MLAPLLALWVAQTPAEPASPSEHRTLWVAGTSAAIAGAVLLVGSQAWWEDGLKPFRFRETGFFGKDTYAGGSDKFGHMWTSFAFTGGTAFFYEQIGLDRETAAWYSAIFNFALFNGFELIDGFTDFGFEYGDVVMNTFGVGLALMHRLYPVTESLLGLRLGYVPSRDLLANDKNYVKSVNDYTGMLFYLDIKAKGVFELAGKDPGLGRYLLAGVVWGTNQYSPVRVDEDRQRLFGVHLGLSMRQLLYLAADGDGATETVGDLFEYFAVPFLSVAVLKDLNGQDWYLNFGVSNRSQVRLGD